MSPEILVARMPPGTPWSHLIRIPTAEGILILASTGGWPEHTARFCTRRHHWPADVEVLERIPLESCTRRGAAIDIVARRGRRRRSTIVIRQGAGRESIFWNSPQSLRRLPPGLRIAYPRLPWKLGEITVAVDTRERYGYGFRNFAGITVVKRPLRVGDYAALAGERIVARVERKSLADFTAAVVAGRMAAQMHDLGAGVPGAVVVEGRYSQLFRLPRVRNATFIADLVVSLQLAIPGVPVMFAESRGLGEDWTYRFLASAMAASLAPELDLGGGGGG